MRSAAAAAAARALLRPGNRANGLDKVALYIRTGHSLRNRIGQGEWAAGTQLPTISDLAKEYRVALVTIRQALQLLSAEGLISSTRGRGTFVCAGVKPVAQNPGLRAAINDRLAMPGNCSIKVLGRTFSSELPTHFVPAGTDQYPEYAIIEKLHLHDGEPFSYIKVMVARPIYQKFPKGADGRDKILKLILDQGRLKLRRSHLEIVLAYADDLMATLLHCAPLAPLVRIRTSRVDTQRKVVLCHDSYYRGDKFVYEVQEEGVELGRSSGVVLPSTLGEAQRA
jgi:DNA-binding GntR family transcriptional regulator